MAKTGFSNNLLYGVQTGLFDARVTGTSGDPEPTADQTALTKLYLTPMKNGKVINLWHDNGLKQYNLTEIEYTVAGTSGKNYDLFVYDNSGTLTLVRSAEWTNDTTRADAITVQNGFQCLSGSPTHRWVLSFRCSDTDKTEDSVTKRFLSNVYNKMWKTLLKEDATSHNYNTDTIRQWNADPTAKVEFVVCDSTHLVKTNGGVEALSDTASVVFVAGFGLDATNSLSGSRQIRQDIGVANITYGTAIWRKDRPAAGYHYLSINETGSGSAGTKTWTTARLHGEIEC